MVIPFFPPAFNYGGPVQVSYNLSKELVKNGHEVTVYTTDTLGQNGRIDKKNEIIDGIRVIRFRNLSNHLAFRFNIHLVPGLLFKSINEIEKFDIIHNFEYRTTLNLIIHHYAQKHDIPYILQAAGSVPRIMSKYRLKQLYDIFWGYTILKHAARVIASSQIEIQQYQSMGVIPGKINTIPNGINLAEFENLPHRGIFREKFGIDTDQNIILFLARIDKIKGLDLLVEAFANLFRHMRNTKLVIIGPDNGYLSIVRKKVNLLNISDSVLFFGPLYGQEKLSAYIDADVYILPSLYENFGITVMEALACGTPVIVTDRCGVAKFVDGHGAIVVPYDADLLGQAILNFLNLKIEERQALGNKGKLLVLEQFDWSKITKDIERIYFECISLKKQK